MITTAELHRFAEKEGLRFDQTEKDYEALRAAVQSGRIAADAECENDPFHHYSPENLPC